MAGLGGQEIQVKSESSVHLRCSAWLTRRGAVRHLPTLQQASCAKDKLTLPSPIGCRLDTCCANMPRMTYHRLYPLRYSILETSSLLLATSTCWPSVRIPLCSCMDAMNCLAEVEHDGDMCAAASLDGLVEASRQSRVCGGVLHGRFIHCSIAATPGVGGHN